MSLYRVITTTNVNFCECVFTPTSAKSAYFRITNTLLRESCLQKITWLWSLFCSFILNLLEIEDKTFIKLPSTLSLLRSKKPINSNKISLYIVLPTQLYSRIIFLYIKFPFDLLHPYFWASSLNQILKGLLGTYFHAPQFLHAFYLPSVSKRILRQTLFLVPLLRFYQTLLHILSYYPRGMIENSIT